MRKLLLFFVTSLLCLNITAQERLVLLEAFTSPEAPHHASYDNYLRHFQLLEYDNVILIKYPIPGEDINSPTSTAIFFDDNPNEIRDRATYYNIDPDLYYVYARLDGVKHGNGAILHNILNEKIDNASIEPTDFDIQFKNYNRIIGNNQVTFDIEVTSSIGQSLNDVVLQVALIESTEFETPPGLSQQTIYDNIVRKMYPDANGQAIQSSFNADETQQFSFTITLPSYVDNTNPDLQFVAFLQDNSNKSILNSTISGTISLDAYSLLLTSENQNQVTCGAVNNLPLTSKFKNIGTDTITSIKYYYQTRSEHYGNSNWLTSEWNGTLAPLQSTEFEFDELSGVELWYDVIDSIGEINGIPIENPFRSSTSLALRSLETSPSQSLPYEKSIADIEFFQFSNDNTFQLYTFNYTDPVTLEEVSIQAFQNQLYYPGEQLYLIFPLLDFQNGDKTLEFDLVYSPRNDDQDKLEVVYTNDCGASWVTVWEAAGEDLATLPPRTSHISIWEEDLEEAIERKVIDISDVPNDAFFALKFTSDAHIGNDIFVRDFLVKQDGVSTHELLNDNHFSIYPNPANHNLYIKSTSNFKGRFNAVIYDLMGKKVYENNIILNGDYQNIELPIGDLKQGIYTLQLISDNAIQQMKFNKL